MMSVRRISRSWIALGGALLAAACTTLGFAYLNGFADPTALTITRDIAYGSQPWQRLDIYRSTAITAAAPVVIFFYGGGWSSGSKDDYLFVADRLARQGFTVVIPDYVKYPQAKFPAFVEDAARATAWVQQHIGSYGGDAQHIHILGHSAGAHIGALLLCDRHYLPNRVGIRSFAGLAGPYDFIPDEPKYIAIFGPPEHYPAMQAAHFVNGHEPPMLLVTGDKDSTVKTYNRDRMVAAIHAKGGQVESRDYPDLNHIDLIAVFSKGWPRDATLPGDVADFFRRNNG